MVTTKKGVGNRANSFIMRKDGRDQKEEIYII